MSDITDRLMGESGGTAGESGSPSLSLTDRLMGNSAPTGVEEKREAAPTSTFIPSGLPMNMGNNKPRGEEGQLARKVRGFVGGMANTVADSATGLFRISEHNSDKKVKEAQEVLQRLRKKGETSGYLWDAYSQQAGMYKEIGKKRNEQAGTIDSFWDDKLESLQLHDQTFWDQVAVGTGQLPIAAASANPAVGLPLIYARMFNEGYDTFIAAGDSEAEAKRKAELYAQSATPLEFLIDRFIISKGGVKGLRGLGGKEAIAQGSKNVVALGKKMGLSGGGEGITEVIQEAISNKMQGKPMFDENTANTFLVSSTIGLAGGGAYTLTSAKQQAGISNDMRDAGMGNDAITEVVNDLEIGDIAAAQTRLDQEGVALNPEVLGNMLEEDDLTYEVAEYKVGAGKLGKLALKTATKELEEELGTMQDDTLAALAEEIGYDGDGTKADMQSFVLNNRGKLKSFDRKTRKTLLNTIEGRQDLTKFDKQVFKWLATGNISMPEVGMVAGIFTEQAKEAGFDSVESYFEAFQGEFTAPSKERFELFQRERGLSPESNPMSVRAKGAATVKVGARANLPEETQGAITPLLRPLENAWRLITDIGQLRNRLPEEAEKREALVDQLHNLPNPTPAQTAYLEYVSELVLDEDKARDTLTENNIQDALIEEERNILVELDKYNPFPPMTPANGLYYHILRRKSFRKLGLDPLLDVDESKYNTALDYGTVGGLNANKKKILAAASHEAFHGIFEDIEGKIDKKTDEAWKKKASALAKILYSSAGSNSQRVVDYLAEEEHRSADELLAMYISNEYNSPLSVVQQKADTLVENLFEEALGEQFVNSMRMSREAFEARSVPDNPAGQEFVEFHQSEAYHGGRGVDGKPFSNFDLTYSGSGEGAAAFGHGVYLTEKFGIGKGYAKALTDRDSDKVKTVFGANRGDMGIDAGLFNVLFELADYATKFTGSPKAAHDNLRGTLERRLAGMDSRIESAKTATHPAASTVLKSYLKDKEDYTTALTWLENHDPDTQITGEPKSNEFVYKTTIFEGQEEHEYNLLSWYDDAPTWLGETVTQILAEQGNRSINKMSGDRIMVWDKDKSQRVYTYTPNDTGEVLYDILTKQLGSKKAASQALDAKGVDGIVFPTQSVGTGKTTPKEGDRNFVIFNEKNVKIEEARAYDASLEYFQKGNKTKSGNDTIRGRTVFRPDGKFIVDLMQGGDVLTLAHEFSHVFSPHMSPAMVDSMIDRVIKENGQISLDRSKKSRDQLKIYMQGVWKTFTNDPFHERFLNKEGKDFQYLVAMQEELATQFETYLATRTAPTSNLTPAFKVFAKRYRDYYGKIRKLPKPMQKVDHKIATLFDEMIAGESALPRVQARRITVDGDTMTLHLSKPKEAIRKKTLQALEKVDADRVGLQEAVQDYANEVLDGNVPAVLPLEIGNIRDNKQALQVMLSIDQVLAKRQLVIKKNLTKSIRDMASKQGLKDVDPSVKKLIEDTLINIDLKSKSEKRVRKAAGLRAVIAERLIKAQELGHEDLATTRDELRELVAINNPSIYNMSIEQLQILQDAISDLIKYDDVRASQHAKEMERKLTKRTDEFSSDTRKTWQWNDRGSKKTVISSKLGSVYRRFFGGTLENPSRTVEDLHAQGKRLYNDLNNGRVTQDATDQHFTDRLKEITSGVNLEGVSSTLGPAPKQKIKMKQITSTKVKEWDPETNMYKTVVKRGGKPATLEMTTGQLLYVYGITKNEDGYRHVVNGGIMRPQGTGKNLGDETARFQFRSEEEMQTILQTIPLELRNMVDEIMAMYENEVAPLINETSRELLGVDIANVINYLPMAIEGRARGDKRVLHLSQLGNKGKKFALQQVEHASFLQTRSGGSNALYAMDLFAMLDRNLADVAEYVGMAEPIRTATAILQPGGLGSTYEEIAEILGKKRADRLWAWIGTLEDPSIKQSDTDRAINKLSSVVRRGILKLNISVSLSQVVSLNNIKNYLTDGGVRLDLAASVMGSDGTPLKAKYSRREMATMHPTLRKRFEGVPEVGLKSEGENARAQRRFGRQGGLGSKVASNALLLGETGIGPVKKMDAWAVSKLIETVERQAERHGWNQEEKWNKIIQILNRTQPTSDPLQTSYFIGSPSNGVKKFVFGVFQSARDNVRGEIQTNWTNYRKGKHLGDKKLMQTSMQNMFRSWVTGAAAVAVIQEAVQRLLKGVDEDEDNPFLLDVALRTLMNMIGIVPIAGTVIAGAIDSALGNYTGDINSPLLQQLSTMMKMANLPEDEEDMDAYMQRLIKETAGMMGSGWKNVIRQAERLFKEED